MIISGLTVIISGLTVIISGALCVAVLTRVLLFGALAVVVRRCGLGHSLAELAPLLGRGVLSGVDPLRGRLAVGLVIAALVGEMDPDPVERVLGRGPGQVHPGSRKAGSRQRQCCGRYSKLGHERSG